MSVRVSTRVKRIVNERIDQAEDLRIMYLGRSGSGHSRLIRILLVAEKPVSTELIEKIKSDIRETLGHDTPVLIGVFQNAVIVQPKTPPSNAK